MKQADEQTDLESFTTDLQLLLLFCFWAALIGFGGFLVFKVIWIIISW